MKSKIIVNKVYATNNIISYDYTVEGEIEKFFIQDQKLSIEYNYDISCVPESILIIPLVCNILPVVWICDAELVIDKIDYDFYESIKEFKRGYIEMYPNMKFLGKLEYLHRERNKVNEESKSLAFFSGGADAFCTLLQHISDKPSLVTICGADVSLEDISGWNNVVNHVNDTSNIFGLSNVCIKSNFRKFMNEMKLEELVAKSNDGWWHGFQHGIGLIGHAAPYAYAIQATKVYIASSFCADMKGKYTCASDPTIDNFVEFFNCKVIHDGYEYRRQDKIKLICDYSKANKTKIPLRVCWESSGGRNCCECEKCYRTIMEIVSEGANPNDFGFVWKDKEITRFIRRMRFSIIIPTTRIITYWFTIQKRLCDNSSDIKNYNKYKWFAKTDLNKFNDRMEKIFYIKIIERIKRKIGKVLHGGKK